jgi:hypothetical protein
VGVDLIVGRAEVAFDEEPFVLGIEDGALVLVATRAIIGPPFAGNATS